MLWALVWSVLGVAAAATLGLLVRRDVLAALALLRELATASEQLARVSALSRVSADPTATSEPPGVHAPAALGGLRAAEDELRRYLDWPMGVLDAPTPRDGRTMHQQRPPLEV